ncbi:MAG: YdeI/OmpD-associated family protein [Phycisphaerales bacterium]|nr:YdeI/OmpD-associated family protein [Phycisphaerales bacterium]
MKYKDVGLFYPKNRQEWRQWLEKNHHIEESIKLVYCKADSKMATITWSDSVDEALCFGWIDGRVGTIDENKYTRLFSKRKVYSTWSKINKEKVARLTEQGLMRDAGLLIVEQAKKNGSWIILDDVEDLVIPLDLEKQLAVNPLAQQFFMGLSKSVKKTILQWLVLAKRPETREKRILNIVESATRGKKPEQF